MEDRRTILSLLPLVPEQGPSEPVQRTPTASPFSIPQFSILNPQSPIPHRSSNQFTALLRSGLIKDMLCAFSDERNTFWAFAELGENVCGHPR